MTSKHLGTVHPDDDIETVIAVMEREQVRRIPVVSEDYKLGGVIAQADLAIKIGLKDPQKLEEVVERVSAPHKSAAGV